MMRVIVQNRIQEAHNVVRLVLGLQDGRDLPPFSAGAHIDITLPSGLIRQYSLCRLQSDKRYYEIAVLKDPQSRGGSEQVHQLAIGDPLDISQPKNHFPLINPYKPALLIAGGIGITPLLPMAQTLQRLGTAFSLHYCAKSPETAAFAHALSTGSFASNLQLHYSQTPVPNRINLTDVLSQHRHKADLYVCGPTHFMQNVLEQARQLGWLEDNLHKEFFAAPATDNQNTTNRDFTLRIASTNAQLTVKADKTIAQTLDENGFFIPLSCGGGVCGTCLTKVISGTPEHRDVFLTDAEKQSGQWILPCCSRASSDELTLDL